MAAGLVVACVFVCPTLKAGNDGPAGAVNVGVGFIGFEISMVGFDRFRLMPRSILSSRSSLPSCLLGN